MLASIPLTQMPKLGLGRAGDEDLVFPTYEGKLRSPNATTKEWYRARGFSDGLLQVNYSLGLKFNY